MEGHSFPQQVPTKGTGQSLTWLSCLPGGLLLWLLSYKQGDRTDVNLQLGCVKSPSFLGLWITVSVLNQLTPRQRQ